MMTKTWQVRDIVSVAVAATPGVVVAALTALTTLKGDDLMCLYVFGSDYTRPCVTLSDYWASFVAQYLDENGRLGTNLLQLTMVFAGQRFFAVVNAAVAVLLAVACSRMATQWKHSLAALCLTIALLLWFIPFPGETMLWMGGSYNYMWGPAMTLALLWWLARHTTARGVMVHIAVAACAFLAGNINETITVPTLAAAVLWLLIHRERRTPVMYTALAGYAAGLAVIVFVPAMMNRAAVEFAEHGEQVTALSFATSHLLILVKMGIKRLVVPAIAAVVIAVRLWRHGPRSLSDFATLCYLMCAGFLFILGYDNKPRVYTHWVVMSIVIVVGAVLPLLRRQWRATVAAAALASCAMPLSQAFTAVTRHRTMRLELERQIAATGDVCVLPAVDYTPGRWVAPEYYDSERFNSYQALYCAYYGKRVIAFLRPPLMEHYLNADSLSEGAVEVSYHSSRPHLLQRVLYFPGKSYTLLPIDSSAVVHNDYFLIMHVDRPERRLTDGITRPYGGTLRPMNRLPFYVLPDRNTGQRYLVVPPADDDITAYDIPVLDHDTLTTVTLTRR